MPFWLRFRAPLARAIGLDLTHSQTRYGEELDRVLKPGTRWLDLGCGHQIIPDFLYPPEKQRRWVDSARRFVGADTDAGLLAHPLLRLRVKALGGTLPFRAGSFDVVTANMVAEHLPDPRAVLEDVRRVLAPGGRFTFQTPNYLYYLIWIASWTPERLKKWLILRLEHRPAEDVFPAYYRMNTARRVHELAREAGFRVERLEVVGAGGSFLFLGPIGLAELFVLRALQTRPLRGLQSNLIVTLVRDERATPGALPAPAPR
ncbi:MAG TPA: class I SAM-dependent methyltransferase [Myxococcota bacterium]|nr:class I SAM-dependent methyltransferase [Myxococcota bacterium]